MSDFKQKYLKYKKKYLDLKEQIGGDNNEHKDCAYYCQYWKDEQNNAKTTAERDKVRHNFERSHYKNGFENLQDYIDHCIANNCVKKRQSGGEKEEMLLNYHLECALKQDNGFKVDVDLHIEAKTYKKFGGLYKEHKIRISINNTSKELKSPFITMRYDTSDHNAVCYDLHKTDDKIISIYKKIDGKELTGRVEDHYFNENKIPTDPVTFEKIYNKLKENGFK